MVLHFIHTTHLYGLKSTPINNQSHLIDCSRQRSLSHSFVRCFLMEIFYSAGLNYWGEWSRMGCKCLLVHKSHSKQSLIKRLSWCYQVVCGLSTVFRKWISEVFFGYRARYISQVSSIGEFWSSPSYEQRFSTLSTRAVCIRRKVIWLSVVALWNIPYC